MAVPLCFNVGRGVPAWAEVYLIGLGVSGRDTAWAESFTVDKFISGKTFYGRICYVFIFV
jgi:hypothetical protein